MEGQTASGRQPFEVWGLDIRFVELHDLDTVVQGLDRRCPRLSDAEIDRIARQVAVYLTDLLPAQVPASEQEQWRERLTSTAKDLAVGLASSGIWALLVYVAQVAELLAPSDDEAVLDREYRRHEIRLELSRDLETDDRKDLEASSYVIRDAVLPSVVDTILRRFDEDSRTRDYRTHLIDYRTRLISAAGDHERIAGWEIREAALTLVGGLVAETVRRMP